MKTNALNEIVFQKLREFDTLESINPSADWDAELNLKINSSVKTNYTAKYNLILVCIVILNFGLLLFSIVNDSKTATIRTMNLKLISNELLLTSN
jgi:hypothetical protein